ncbi:hypothetical protein F5Y11DRAFT_365257 [Daldinia sp. FL1419]|nr:hypothetical protein F5Y11DRAFT_365257 [Daldinia sp. FL1419]
MADTQTAALNQLSPEYLAEDNHTITLNAAIVLIVLLTVIYALFNTSRWFFAERNGWEVWTLYPLSYISCLTMAIMYIRGVGRHTAYWLLTDPKVMTVYLQMQTGSEFLYMLNVTVPKVCILILYLRIFTEKYTRLATSIVIGIVVANYVAVGIFAIFLICHPFAYKWNKTLDGHCGNLSVAYLYTSLPNLFTDVAILVLPLPMLYKLQVSTQQKIGISITFLTGSLGLLTSIARCIVFIRGDWMSDPTYKGSGPIVLGLVEPCAYFICSCLPGMRPLGRAIWKALASRKEFQEPKGFYSSPSPHSKPTNPSGYDSGIGNPYSSYKTSTSALTGSHKGSGAAGNVTVLQLDKIDRVGYSNGRVAPRDLV